MESVLLGGFFTALLTILGLLFRDLNRKINGKVSRELCRERTHSLFSQLERQERILLRTEQRLIRIEKRLAYLNGERGNEPDFD